jgi:hypothetical protein
VLEGELLAAEGAVPSGDAVAAALDSWSQGPKTLLYIRVKFSDQAPDPQTLTDSQNMMNSVNNFFGENSYDTTTITTTFTPVYTLSNNTAYYNSNGIYTLRSDALALATADGYNYVNWNLDAVRYNGGPGAFSGAAYVHARGCWLKSSSAGGLLANCKGQRHRRRCGGSVITCGADRLDRDGHIEQPDRSVMDG